MTHYSTEEWIDFVNGASSTSARSEMQHHLDAGCKDCGALVAWWQKVHRTAAGQAGFEPPADAVRVVKASFVNAGYKPQTGLAGIIAELIFDSFKQPAMAGARSAGIQSRQVLFSANSFQIDLNIEARPGESRLFVTGQLMDSSAPDSIGRGVPVTLSNRRGQTIQTVTNNFGEFHGEIENRGDLELSFPGKEEKPVIVSLRDALSHVSGGSRGGNSPALT